MDNNFNQEEDFIEVLSVEDMAKEFKSLEAFKDWVEQIPTLDLEDIVLPTFEAYELYEHCVIIRDVLDERE